MTLRFVNPSRRFDETRNAVGFVGHDGVFEVGFFVEAGALAQDAVEEREAWEVRCLTAFDKSLGSIHDVARRVYAGKRLDSYTLSAADFRQGAPSVATLYERFAHARQSWTRRGAATR